MEAAGGPCHPAIGGLTLKEYDEILFFGNGGAGVSFDGEAVVQHEVASMREERRTALGSTLRERREAVATRRAEQLASGEIGPNDLTNL